MSDPKYLGTNQSPMMDQCSNSPDVTLWTCPGCYWDIENGEDYPSQHEVRACDNCGAVVALSTRSATIAVATMIPADEADTYAEELAAVDFSIEHYFPNEDQK